MGSLNQVTPPPPGRGTDAAVAGPLGVRLTVVFQPILAWQRSTVLGYEALIRPWRDARPLAPRAWLEAATAAGHGVAADVACLAALTAQLRAWGGWPGPGALFVNVRWGTLATPAAFEPAWAELAAWVDPAHVVWEVAEHGARAPVWAEVAARYPAATWALDDFGVGTADLWRWAALNPTWVKIDRLLVARVAADPRTAVLVEAVTAAAHRLGSRVIAEGIETPTEAAACRALGVDAGQGMLLGPPQPGGPRGPGDGGAVR